MSFIARLSLPGKPADPHPVLLAYITDSGKSIVYRCPWCHGRHRHRYGRTITDATGYTTRQTHCAVWRRLHPRRPDFVRLTLAYDFRSQRAA